MEQMVVQAGTLELPTVFVSANELRATLPSDLLSNPGTVEIRVVTGMSVSVTQTFTIIATGEVSGTSNPQVAKYSIVSPRDAQVRIEFGLDTNYGLQTWARPTAHDTGQVDILVAGMLPFSTYHMRAVVQFSDGATHFDSDHTFTTGGPAPDKIPPMTANTVDPSATVGGVQLFDLTGNAEGQLRAFITDLEGSVIWYFNGNVDGFPFPIRFLPNGNFLIVDGTGLREFNLAGDTMREITPAQVNQALIDKGMEPVADNFHHDAIMLPNGHLVILTSYTKNIDGTDFLGDGVVDLDEDLSPVWEWSSFDHLDTGRQVISGPEDWTHGNAVVYSPADRNLLVSLRHQSWVLKIDYQDGVGTGNVLWRLGRDGDFTLSEGAPEKWQYAQHYPFIVDDQMVFYRLAMFDNGVARVMDDSGTLCGDSGAPACYSRAVIFQIDEAMQTASVAWEDVFPFFASIIGSIQVFDNGNVVWDAGIINGERRAIIREVTQEQPPQTVWELEVTGQLAYRSLRLPSLYPGVQW